MTVPIIHGIVVGEQLAYVLSRGIDIDEVDDRLADWGYGPKWRSLAREALQAIADEGRSWAHAAQAELERERASTASEPVSVPQAERASSSEWMTVTAAAAALAYSPSYVRRLAREKKLDGRQVGRDWQLDAASVATYAERNGGAA